MISAAWISWGGYLCEFFDGGEIFFMLFGEVLLLELGLFNNGDTLLEGVGVGFHGFDIDGLVFVFLLEPFEFLFL